ncbi:MAG: hypothetical protein BEN18_09090 [Epulopiscium sp. Nuni2H_MBin001]|nr:MAG: hypothetical protein BEN18_09090 [Epulopiscium sp. Nuni2H_MBin001]
MIRCYFSDYHPIVLFIYFISVISFAIFLMHPVCLLISISAAISYLALLRIKKYMLAIFLIISIINPLFNHAGVTILFYLPTGNPFTLESLLYGIATSFMIITVIAWFCCYNKVVTSDKLLYLFGKLLPQLSLIISMVLRLIPLYKIRFNKIMHANPSDNAFKTAALVVSIMVTWSMETAIDTADSMKARGYGLPNRTTFSNYKLTTRDIVVSIGLVVMSGYLICSNKLAVTYIPIFNYTQSLPDFIIYTILCYTPIILSIMEELKWKYLISKI